jgi:hypothetical protein
MNYSIIQKSQLEGAERIDAEYYQPEYIKLKSILEKADTQELKELSDFIKKEFLTLAQIIIKKKVYHLLELWKLMILL